MKSTLEKHYKIQQIRSLTDSAYVVRFDRNGIKFLPGQHILLGPPNQIEAREYSIYSGTEDDYLEVLIKEVVPGNVSRKLKRLEVGEELMFDGPVGYFTLNMRDVLSKKYYLIASGTGIAPFHSFVRSYEQLDYTLLHGVKYGNEAYERDHYEQERYILCTSRDEEGDFNGRVTEYLKQNEVDTDALFYLCGNINMIHDCFDILQQKGVDARQLQAEVYF
ncbi:MAG: hypothetical protein K9I94_02075 [Bacteroidales bacterium]|nr:hypothetical protein [Bacteroidales bacterium]